MLDLGWSELLVIAVVAIIVVGPKDLPRLMRSVGQWIRKARRMATEFQQGLEDMVRDEELTSIRKDVEQMTRMDPTSGSSAPKPKAVAAKPASDASAPDASAPDAGADTGGGAATGNAPAKDAPAAAEMEVAKAAETAQTAAAPAGAAGKTAAKAAAGAERERG